MKRLTYSLKVLGFGFLFVLGTAVLDSHANGGCSPKNPLRGTWGWHQFAPFFTPDISTTPPFPVTEIGNLSMDECGDFVAHGVVNAPSFVTEFDFNGTCETPVDGLFKCTLPMFGNAAVRACVATARKGTCFDEFHCVVGDATVEPLTVVTVEVKRQAPGTCK
jgi:hypothetical protein